MRTEAPDYMPLCGEDYVEWCRALLEWFSAHPRTPDHSPPEDQPKDEEPFQNGDQQQGQQQLNLQNQNIIVEDPSLPVELRSNLLASDIPLLQDPAVLTARLVNQR